MHDEERALLIATEWGWSGRHVGGARRGWAAATLPAGDGVAAGAFGWVTPIFAVSPSSTPGYGCFWVIRHLPTGQTLERYGYFACATLAQQAVAALMQFEAVVNWCDGPRALRTCSAPSLWVAIDDAIARAVPIGRWKPDDDGLGLQQVDGEGWLNGPVLVCGSVGGGEGR
jgi:hypothetical protein